MNARKEDFLKMFLAARRSAHGYNLQRGLEKDPKDTESKEEEMNQENSTVEKESVIYISAILCPLC